MRQLLVIGVLSLLTVSMISVDSLCGRLEESDSPVLNQRFIRADGATTDTKTGLPTRILHKASGIALVLIPAGEFMMGSPENEAERSKGERQHRRLINKPFYLGQTEVSVGQFRRFVRATGYQTDAERGTPDGDRNSKGAFATTLDGERDWNPAANWQNPFPNFKDYRLRENHPVVQVSWNDARQFCAHFNLQLPSEAQWEYAARAGSRSRFFWGEAEAGGKGFANLADLARKKRFSSTNVFFPFDDGAAWIAPVGGYKPNSWKLYDLLGNVEEWCEDAYQKYPEDGADESAAQGESGAARILRGGSWVSNSTSGRVATRIGMKPSSRRDFQGFRVAASLENVR